MEVSVGNSARMMSAQFTMAPGLTERMLATMVDRQHLQDSPQEPTPGNVLEPMEEWTSVDGGWRTDSGGSARKVAFAAAAAVPVVLGWRWLRNERAPKKGFLARIAGRVVR